MKKTNTGIAKEEPRRYPIRVNAPEIGALIGLIVGHQDLEKVLEQLEALLQKFKDDAGVEIERNGDKVTMTDRKGNTYTRNLYPWET